MFQGVHWHWQNRAKFSFNIWGSIAQALNWRLCERKWKLLCQLLFQWQLSPFHFILLCKDPFCLLLLLSLCVYILPTQLMRFGGFLIAVVKKGVKYLYTLWICTSVYWLGADGGVSLFFGKWPHRYHFVLMKGWWMLVSINEAVIMHTMVWFLSALSVCLSTESKTFETSCTYLHWVVNIALSTAYHLPLYYFGTTIILESNVINVLAI